MRTFESILNDLVEAIQDSGNQEMYRKLAMYLHPDRNPEDAGDMAALNVAKDAGDWGKIRRLYQKHFGLPDEEERPTKKPSKVSEVYRLYNDWAHEIQDELGGGIRIFVELQGASANAWLHSGVKKVYIPKIDRFQTKRDFKNEVSRRLKSL